MTIVTIVINVFIVNLLSGLHRRSVCGTALCTSTVGMNSGEDVPPTVFTVAVVVSTIFLLFQDKHFFPSS